MTHPQKFRNIIFDFGGVLFDIDYQLTAAAFKNTGMPDFEMHYTRLKQDHFFDDFETGAISSAEFRNRIRSISGLSLSDAQVDEAWNALLIGLPHSHVRFLESIKEKHTLFLLSNTNAIHEDAFSRMIKNAFGKNVLPEVFKKVYLSHHLGMRKPDVKIFRHVLDENDLQPSETLFVDDSPQHIAGAKQAGLQTFYFERGMKPENIFGPSADEITF